MSFFNRTRHLHITDRTGHRNRSEAVTRRDNVRLSCLSRQPSRTETWPRFTCWVSTAGCTAEPQSALENIQLCHRRTSMSLLCRDGLTLNVQLKRSGNVLPQLIPRSAQVFTAVARVDAGQDQRLSRLPVLFVVFEPGVVGRRRVGSAPAEQSHRAALQYRTVGVDDDCGVLWRNWTSKPQVWLQATLPASVISAVFSWTYRARLSGRRTSSGLRSGYWRGRKTGCRLLRPRSKASSQSRPLSPDLRPLCTRCSCPPLDWSQRHRSKSPSCPPVRDWSN